MFFKSLKREILIFTLGLLIITIFIAIALAVSSTRTAGSAAEGTTANVLREQAKESLVQIVESAANQQDLLFGRIRNEMGVFTPIELTLSFVSHLFIAIADGNLCEPVCFTP